MGDIKKYITECDDISDITLLKADLGVRHWESASINGIYDNDESPTMPCRDDGRWKPVIDWETGQIMNWETGKTASTCYKVVDDGIYRLFDSKGNELAVLFYDYVPDMMCPSGTGFGDYVIMDIDKNGFIENWENNIKDFMEEA